VRGQKFLTARHLDGVEADTAMFLPAEQSEYRIAVSASGAAVASELGSEEEPAPLRIGQS
jgi:hypothetical protein